MALFADGGAQPISLQNWLPPLLAVAAVLLLIPRRWRLVRVGAVIYGLGVILTWLIPSLVGSNVARLGELLAGPLLVGMGRARFRWLLAVALGAAGVWQVAQPIADLGQGNAGLTLRRLPHWSMSCTRCAPTRRGSRRCPSTVTGSRRSWPQSCRWRGAGSASWTLSGTRCSMAGSSHPAPITRGSGTTPCGTSPSRPGRQIPRRWPKPPPFAKASRGWCQSGATGSGSCTGSSARTRWPARRRWSPIPRPRRSPCA